MKKRVVLCTLALVLALAASFVPAAEAHHSPFCPLDSGCVADCYDYCTANPGPSCQHLCVFPQCCIRP